MMKIGLIDVDGHRFPNLALMRISAWHKEHGDDVEWWMGDFFHYDIVYKSKIFSDEYSADVPDPVNADKVIHGGSGYCIHLVDGKEVFDQSQNNALPPEMERMFPDYSIYPQYNFAVSMTSRGCPETKHTFCHVGAKEGRCTIKVADVKDFWNGQKEICVLDPNITALKESDKRDLFRQYRGTGARIDFSQGLSIKLINDADIADINAMKVKNIHFAWDIPTENLREKFRAYAKKAKHKCHGSYGSVYVLTNFNSTMEENLYRVYTLREMNYDPYIMIYDKKHAPQEIRDLQRWCNAKQIFKSCHDFNDYKKEKRKNDSPDL